MTPEDTAADTLARQPQPDELQVALQRLHAADREASQWPTTKVLEAINARFLALGAALASTAAAQLDSLAQRQQLEKRVQSLERCVEQGIVSRALREISAGGDWIPPYLRADPPYLRAEGTQQEFRRQADQAGEPTWGDSPARAPLLLVRELERLLALARVLEP